MNPNKISPPDYSSVDYWNKRYQQEVGLSFDWLRTYEEIKDIIIPYLINGKESEIVVAGCGNSLMSEGLYHDGYKNISNIDFSEELISQMVERYKDYDEMEYQVMDVANMGIDSESIDCIIDKAVLDSVMCGVNCQEATSSMINSIYNILVDGGVYICISCAPVETRESIFKKKGLEWDMKVHKLPIKAPKEPLKYHYIYVLIKNFRKI